MDEELRFHLGARAAHFVAQGLSPEESARRARLEFGNPEAWQEQCRDARGLRLLGELRADLRYALHGFRRHPLLSATVVLTLTLGIGVSSGVFTLISALALRPPVEKDPASFVDVYTSYTGNARTDRTRSRRPAPRNTSPCAIAFRRYASWPGPDRSTGGSAPMPARTAGCSS